MWWWIGLALAAPPERSPATFDAGTGEVKRLAVSGDGGIVGGVSGGNVTVLDMASWASGTTGGDCSANAVALASRTAGGYWVYVGCDGGEVRTWTWDADTLAVYEDASGSQEVFTAGTGNIRYLYEYAVTGDLHVFENTGSGLAAHSIDPVTAVVTESLSTNLQTGFVGVAPDVGGTQLWIAHGGREYSTYTFSSGSFANPTTVITSTVDPVDLFTPPGVAATGVYVVDDGGDIAVVASLSAIPVVRYTSIGNTHAATGFTEADGSPWVVASVGSRIEVWDDSGVTEPAAATTSVTVGWQAADMIQVDTEYAVAGTTDGLLAILTANPWLENVVISPDAGISGDVVTITFDTDTAGDWELLGDSSRSRDGSDLGLTGTASAAGTITAELTIDDTWTEGSHEIWAYVTDSSGRTGHAAGTFTVDNVPSSVTLADESLVFADGALTVDFAGVTDSDLESYAIYVSSVAFTSADYPTSGPDFATPNPDALEAVVDAENTGDTDEDATLTMITNPVTATAPTSGTRVVKRLEPLENNVNYYVAVRAMDTSGQEGPMSNVVQGMPRPTYSAADRAGETGGPPPCGCDSGGGGGAAMALALLALGSRFRRGATLLALLCAACLVVPGAAQAQERERQGFFERFNVDETPAWGNVEVRYGVMQPSDVNIINSYGTSQKILFLEGGPQLWRFVEIDFGVGMLTEKGVQVDESGNLSSDLTRMIWLPLSADITGRLHLFDEQPIVPFARFGVDYVFWRESKLDTDLSALSKTNGAKAGTHWGVGGNLLLDLFAPNRASKLESQSGINDTWLTVEYRSQTIGAQSTGLQLSGWSLTAGIKVDY